MKGKDKYLLCIVLLISLISGYFIFNENFNHYSDLITFLSIMIGFKITSLSILFGSPLKKTLYDRKIKPYETELHRLRNFYRSSLCFDILAVLLLFIIPECAPLEIGSTSIFVGKYLIVFPVLTGSIFFFYTIFEDLLRIFVHPTNEA